MDDFEAIAELERYAYDLPPDYMEMAKDRFPLSYEEHFLVEEDRKVVATTRLVELEQNVRQTWKKMGGVSMVATAPEARKRGHYRRLMIHMNEYMRDNGFICRWQDWLNRCEIWVSRQGIEWRVLCQT